SGVLVTAIATLGGPPGSGTSAIFSGLLPGTYTVAETLPAGWITNDASVKTVAVSLNQTGIVTFNNTAVGNLQIVKNTTGGNGIFTFTTAGPSPVAVTTIVTTGGPPGAGSSVIFTGLLPGTYTVTETLPPGWTANGGALTKTVSVSLGGTSAV